MNFNSSLARYKRTNLSFKSRKCYSIKNADADEAEILLYDEIGFWGTTAEDFAREVKAITAKTINVRINSPGGSVFDGFAMFNALDQHPAHIVTWVDGLAASAATYPALAGNEVNIAKNAYFMIHDPISIAFGNAADFRKEADLMDKLRDTIAGHYVERSNKTIEEIRQMMADETWLNAEESVEIGFADAIVEGKPAENRANKFNLSIFNNVPDALKGGKSEPERDVKSIRELEDLLRDAAGLSNAKAKAIASQFRAKSDPRDEDGELRIAMSSAERLLTATVNLSHSR